MTDVISTGGQEIIYSCNFLTYDNSDCKITFPYEDLVFTFNISFTNRETPKDATFGFHSEDTNFFLELINFKNTLGQGNVTPIKTGLLNNKALSFRFWVSKLGNDTDAYKVELTAFLSEEEEK